MPFLRQQVDTKGELQPLLVRDKIGTLSSADSEPLPKLRQPDEVPRILHLLRLPSGRRYAEHVQSSGAQIGESPAKAGFFHARGGPHPVVAERFDTGIGQKIRPEEKVK